MKDRKLEVYLGERKVGILAETTDRRVAFAYSEEWLDTGFAISPFSLPVEQKVFVPSSPNFHGLWGVFADSLPDAWGQLLVDRMLKAKIEELFLKFLEFCIKLFSAHISEFFCKLCSLHRLCFLLYYELTLDGELVRCKTHSFLCNVLSNSVHLEHNSSGLNYCNPVLG